MPGLRYHPTLSYSRKVGAAVRLHGDPIERYIVDVNRGERRSEEYLSRSAFGRVAVLEGLAEKLSR